MPDNATMYPSTLWGATCDSTDKVCTVELPKLHLGDYLLYNNAGAYASAAASEFNGFPKARSLYFITDMHP